MQHPHHSKKLFTWNEKKIHLSKANQLGAFVTHHFLGRELPTPEQLIIAIESSPNPLSALASEKLKQVQLSKEAKAQREQEKLDKQEKLRIAAASQTAPRGKPNTTNKPTVIESNVPRAKPGRPRRTRTLSPHPSTAGFGGSFDDHPLKRARGVDDDSFIDILKTDEAKRTRSILFPIVGLDEIMSLNHEMITSIHPILQELKSSYNGAFVHALQYFRHLLCIYIRRRFDRSSSGNFDHDGFMNIVKAIFSRHRNADMKLHRHAEKYIFGEGLAFEYYYLIHAVISVIPFSVHNAATLREAAEILVAKVERSCTEEQVKNIKSHFLKFSLESKQLTPEMHVVELSALCSLLPPSLRCDLYEVFSFFKSNPFPNHSRGSLPEHAIISKGGLLLFSGRQSQSLVDKIASLLADMTDDGKLRESLTNPQVIKLRSSGSGISSAESDAHGIIFPKTMDERIRTRIFKFYCMVEPHLANLQMMHSFIGAMNQAIMAACNYPLDTNLVDKAVKLVCDCVPETLFYFMPTLRGIIFRLFTAKPDENIHDQRIEKKTPAVTIDLSNEEVPVILTNRDITSILAGEEIITTHASNGFEMPIMPSSSSPIAEEATVEISPPPSMSDVMMEVCSGVNSPIATVLVDGATDVTAEGVHAFTNDLLPLSVTTITDTVMHSDRPFLNSRATEVTSSANIEMDLDFNPIPIPDSMELGSHDGAREGAQLFMDHIPHDFFQGEDVILSETEADLMITDTHSNDLSPTMFAQCAPADPVIPLFTICTSGSENKDTRPRKDLFIGRDGVPDADVMIAHPVPSLSNNSFVAANQRMPLSAEAESSVASSSRGESSTSPVNMMDIFTSALLAPTEQSVAANSSSSLKSMAFYSTDTSIPRRVPSYCDNKQSELPVEVPSHTDQTSITEAVTQETMSSRSKSPAAIILPKVLTPPTVFDLSGDDLMQASLSADVTPMKDNSLPSPTANRNPPNTGANGQQAIPDSVVITINDRSDQMKFRISKEKQLRKLFRKYYKTMGHPPDSRVFTLRGVELNGLTTVFDAKLVDGDEIQAIALK